MTIWPALDTKFAVCLGRAHGELTIVRRVPLVRAHGESGSVTVCLPSGHTANMRALPCDCRPGTRRIWERCHVPAVRAHGEQPPTPSAGRDGVCPIFFAVRLYIHTAKRFAVCPTFGTRQTRSLPSPWLPSGLCRRSSLAKSSPCAYGVSGCVHSFLAACEIYTTRMTVTFY